MYTVEQATRSIEIDTNMKNVAEVYPNDMKDDYFANHPMYVLLGYVTLDRFTQDFILVANTYEAYRRFLNAEFKWDFVRSTEGPKTKGRLYFQNIAGGVTKMAVVGMKRIEEGEDVKDQFILDWILSYSQALVKMTEGIVLRKAGMIGITNDGSDFVTEGQTEAGELKERLRQEGRWSILAGRY